MISALTKQPLAVAACIGGDYVDIRVLRWIDDLVQLDTRLSKKTTGPFINGDHFEELLSHIAKSLKQEDIEVNQIPVFVSVASQIYSDGGVMLPFYKNAGLGEAVRNQIANHRYYPHLLLKQRLQKEGLNTESFKQEWGNDTLMNIRFAVQKYFKENVLKENDLVYHFISGQGSNGASCLVGKEGSIEDFNCKEPAHRLMPNIEENLPIEGPNRKARPDPVTEINGSAEPYVSGGNPTDKDSGPRATLAHLQSLNNGDLEKALSLLKVKTSIAISNDEFSTLSQQINLGDAPMKAIGEAAKSNKLAKAILIFTADRLADFMIDVIKSEQRNKNNPLKLITNNGGLAKCFKEEAPAAWTRLETRLKDEFGPGLRVELLETAHKMDGAFELAEDAVLKAKAALEKAKC